MIRLANAALRLGDLVVPPSGSVVIVSYGSVVAQYEVVLVTGEGRPPGERYVVVEERFRSECYRYELRLAEFGSEWWVDAVLSLPPGAPPLEQWARP